MNRKFFIVLFVLFFIALSIRLAVSCEFSRYDLSVTAPSAATDMATYKELSDKIIKGEFTGPFYYQPFYYAVFLPCVHFIIGKGIWAVLITQSIIGALTALIAGLVSNRLFGRKAGIATTALLTFSTVMIIYVPYRLIEILFAFWIISLLYFILKTLEKPGRFNWCMTGLLTGLAILTRGNAWILVPGVLALASWPYFKNFMKNKTRKTLAAALLPAIWVAAFVILPQLPFIYHNSVITGKLTGPSTASGAVLALGNTPEAPPGGRNPGTGPGPMEYPPTYSLWMSKESEISISSRILNWFVNEPAAFIELTCRKLLLFWDSREIPNNIDVGNSEKNSVLLRTVGFIPTSVIIVMALAGMFMFSRKIFTNSKFFALFYFMISLWLAISAFYILCRFRVVAIPVMAVFAGGFFSFLYAEARKRNYRKLFTVWLLPFMLGIFICLIAYDFYRYNLEALMMKLVRPNGVSIAVSPAEYMILDNGPFTFGSWAFQEFEKDTVITKKFSTDGKGFTNAKLELSLYWNLPGKAELEINGVRFPIASDKMGLVQHALELPFPPDSAFEIKFISPANGIFYILDFQRDYGRTMVDGKSLGAELVCRLFCSTKPK